MLISRRVFKVVVLLSLLMSTVSYQARASSRPEHVGEFTVDTGFRVKRDGFSFANWSGISPDSGISPSHVLELFRNAGLCTADPVNPTCTLRSGLVVSHDHLEEHLAAGRCEGMAVLAGRIFLHKTKLRHLSDTATRTFNLTKEESEDEIALWWATQLAPNIIKYSRKHQQVSTHKLAHEIVERMEHKVLVTIGIYTPTWSHSVLAIKAHYQSNITKIVVYDSNFPGQTRVLVMNHRLNSWSYKDALMADGSIATVRGRAAGGLDYVPVLLRSKLSGWEQYVNL